MKRYGYCVVVASEGTSTADGRLLSDQGERDAFGHAQLGGLAPLLAGMVKDKLGYKYHWAVADYLNGRRATLPARPMSIRPSRWAKQLWS